MDWKGSFGIENRVVFNPLVCKSTRHVINSNYWWNGKLCTSTWRKTLSTCTHTHTCYTNTTKRGLTHTPALCNRKVSLVSNYDTNSLWERIRVWPLLLPKFQSGCKWGRKNGPNSLMERLFRCEFQYLHMRRLLLYADVTVGRRRLWCRWCT